MDILKLFENPQVVSIETAIIELNDNGKVNDEAMVNLLRQRWLILRDLTRYDDELARLLVDFNQALTLAMTELYNKTTSVYEEYLQRQDYWGVFEVSGKCRLEVEYPKLHPIQSERRKSIWDILTYGYQPLFSQEGCGRSYLLRKDLAPYTLMEFLYLSDEMDNWNEGLDRDWSKGMNLIYPFHCLYEHNYFSLYDLIYLREFNLEINVNFEGNLKVPAFSAAMGITST